MARQGSIEIGKTYNRLTAVECIGKRGKFTAFRFLCACGNTRDLHGYKVANGNTKSCGCLKTERTSALGILSRKNPGEAAMRAVVQSYRNAARRRRLKFSISDETAIGLLQSPCHYCGAAPANRFNTTKYFQGCNYSGIDRVDNKQGYVPGNVVPCCRTCNLAKRDHSLADFKAWIERLYKNLIAR